MIAVTYIEFLVKNAVDNICASLMDRPERVVFLGDNRKQLERNVALYRDVFARRGYEPELIWRTVNKNRAEDVLAELRRMREMYPGCVFDATGGEDLYLVALGMLYGECGGTDISIQRANINSGTFQRYAGENKWVSTRGMPSLSVEEHAAVFGGRVVYEGEVPLGTQVWDMSGEFTADVKGIWQICRENTRQWNQQIKVLETIERHRDGESGMLTSDVSVDVLLAALNRPSLDSVIHTDILAGLIRGGFIEEFSERDGMLRVTYKDLQVKRCLTKAGQALELRVFLAMREATGEAREPVYNDAMTGVCIDWDGRVPEEGSNGPQNEIDVLAMRGVIPVFVSCKNGMVEVDELYKLYSVAENFGGKYARKILIVNGLDPDSDFGRYFSQRAEELSVRVITDFPERTEEELLRLVKSF